MATFDPTKYGAKPVSSVFDPSKYGAVLVTPDTNTTQSATPPTPGLAKQFINDVGSAYVGAAKGIARAPFDIINASQATGQFVGNFLDKTLGLPTAPQPKTNEYGEVLAPPDILRAKSDIETGGGIGAQMFIPGPEAIAGKLLSPLAKVAGPTIETGLNAAENLTTKASQALAERAAQKTAQKIDSLVGKITQGTKQEITKATEALKVVDTTDIKSYSDLTKRADDTIAAFAKKQDQLFDTYGKLFKPTELKPIVKQSIDQLEELYTKTNNPQSLAKLKSLQAKAASQGLTTKEINQLARDYASDMPKAFTKTGEPMTSVNKLAAENTRKQLKAVARDSMPNEASKALDENMSNLSTLKETSQKMDAAAQKLENKIRKTGLLEKIGKAIGKTVDIATGGSIKAFITSFVPSNVGNKVLNSVELEKMLVKNLSKLHKLSETGTDTDILNYIDSLIKAKPPTQL